MDIANYLRNILDGSIARMWFGSNGKS